MLEATVWNDHLVNCIVVLRVFLVLLGLLVASLALILGILFSIGMASATRNADEISAIVICRVWYRSLTAHTFSTDT